MVQNFINDGIDIQFVFQEKGIASGHALVMIGGQGMNYLSVAPGANYKLTPEKIDQAKSVFEEAAIIVMQYEIPVETLKYVIDLANARSIPVMWNFAPARAFDLSYIPKINILVLNELEAGFFSSMQVADAIDEEIAALQLVDS